MRTRRAILYVPGSNREMIEAAASSGVDSICLDLQNGLPNSQKEDSRTIVADALKNIDFGRSERLVRINEIDSGLAEGDLASVLPGLPNGIVIPNVRNSAQIHWVSRQLESIENANYWPENSMVLLAMIESAQAVINLPQICTANSRLVSLLFDADDMAADIGAARTISSTEMIYARSSIVMHSAAYGLQPIDMVSINFGDLRTLRREARQGSELGFVGKQIVHLNQVQTVQEAFTPDPDMVAVAQRIVEAFKKHQEQGKDLFELDGNVVDRRVVRAAERILKRARSFLENNKD